MQKCHVCGSDKITMFNFAGTVLTQCNQCKHDKNQVFEETDLHEKIEYSLV